MSAWFRPAWGRARSTLSILTTSAGRSSRPPKSPVNPVSGALGGGGSVVVVVVGAVVVVVEAVVEGAVAVCSGSPRPTSTATRASAPNATTAPMAVSRGLRASRARRRRRADIMALVGRP
jgi:hypothetical protein